MNDIEVVVGGKVAVLLVIGLFLCGNDNVGDTLNGDDASEEAEAALLKLLDLRGDDGESEW